MQDLISMTSINNSQEQPVTTSLKIAEVFSKKHRSVTRDIRNLDCSKEFSTHNYLQRDYIDSRGKKQPMYILTFNGFMFLCMGYRGERAAQLKEDYINAFNKFRDIATQNLSPAQLILSQAQQLVNIESDVNKLKEDKKKFFKIVRGLNLQLQTIKQNPHQLTLPEPLKISIKSYGIKHNLTFSKSDKIRLGKLCTKLSRERGIEVPETPDENYNTVHIYKPEIIEEVLKTLKKTVDSKPQNKTKKPTNYAKALKNNNNNNKGVN